MSVSLSHALATEETALGPLSSTLARIMATVRGVEGLWVIPVALGMAVPPTSLTWIVPALCLFAIWTAIFAYTALTRGLVTWLIVGDVAVTVALCLVHGHLVPVKMIGDGTGWVAAAASLCVIGLPLAWRVGRSAPAGLIVVAAFLGGFVLAGHPDLGRAHALLMVGQLIVAAIIMGLVRRAARTADLVLTASHEAHRAAAVERAVRIDESEQLRLVHDTALTTLTLVGMGSVAAGSHRLAERAASDLAAIEALGSATRTGPERVVRLDEALANVLNGYSRTLAVSSVLSSCHVPGRVGAAFAGAVDEALRNVSRHAGVDRVDITLTPGAVVVVQVHDAGRGFDPTGVPAHRFGVRQSVVGRMQAVGGTARLQTAPGAGTRWILQWSE